MLFLSNLAGNMCKETTKTGLCSAEFLIISWKIQSPLWIWGTAHGSFNAKPEGPFLAPNGSLCSFCFAARWGILADYPVFFG